MLIIHCSWTCLFGALLKLTKSKNKRIIGMMLIVMRIHIEILTESVVGSTCFFRHSRHSVMMSERIQGIEYADVKEG